jgi:hypothetical protein
VTHLKGGIVEPEEMVVARQWLNEHVSMETDLHATIEKLLGTVFCMWSVPRLHSKGCWEKLASDG